ncbi:MAG TPA: hypothetical protein PLD20_04955 [Blastocatellia bacterium]|nr:hypothetical protein [Blastocatellia bacterium]HMV83550.1 hypothetical protein [Blastocatellia bacterium]HMY75922.1 hypothetical protein [Blastocatellia bacterium]HMZ17257.1 hypothetical protein [Blastocatellia bacterium]HNG28477.1 hypothetical protein [Blastocatellia bacterium]
MRLLLMAIVCTLLFGEAFAQKRDIPSFKGYSVAEIYKGRPASARPSGPRAKMFRTMIKLGAEEGPNFAGHYTIVTWGCGSGCRGVAFVDARTGQVFIAPELLDISTMPFQESPTLQFQLDSSLLIVEGYRGYKSGTYAIPGKWYYKWESNKLKLIFGSKK